MSLTNLICIADCVVECRGRRRGADFVHRRSSCDGGFEVAQMLAHIPIFAKKDQELEERK